MSTREGRRCPRCGSALTVPIVYGLPGIELFKQAERGELLLGGCTLGPDLPQLGCPQCRWPNDPDDPDDDPDAGPDDDTRAVDAVDEE